MRRIVVGVVVVLGLAGCAASTSVAPSSTPSVSSRLVASIVPPSPLPSVVLRQRAGDFSLVCTHLTAGGVPAATAFMSLDTAAGTGTLQRQATTQAGLLGWPYPPDDVAAAWRTWDAVVTFAATHPDRSADIATRQRTAGTARTTLVSWADSTCR